MYWKALWNWNLVVYLHPLWETTKALWCRGCGAGEAGLEAKSSFKKVLKLFWTLRGKGCKFASSFFREDSF